MENLIEIDAECFDCGDLLTKDNYHGFYEIIINVFGLEIKMPICDNCIKSDDGSDKEGAY